MRVDSLPQFIKVDAIRANTVTLHGILAVRKMPRLVVMLRHIEGEVVVELESFLAEQGLRGLRGSINVDLPLTCQRCMQACQHALQADFQLVLVDNEEQAAELPDPYEPIFANEGKVNLVSFLEEEILLQMPIAARHATAECKADYEIEDNSVGLFEAREQEGLKNPWAVLETLKH